MTLSSPVFHRLPLPAGAVRRPAGLLRPRDIGLSLPSMRADTFSMNLMERLQRVRKGGLTFAPEAGTPAPAGRHQQEPAGGGPAPVGAHPPSPAGGTA